MTPELRGVRVAPVLTGSVLTGSVLGPLLLVCLGAGCDAALVGRGVDAGPSLDDAGASLDAGAPVDAATFDASAPLDAGVPPVMPPPPPPPPDPPVDVSAACPSDLCWMATALPTACGERSSTEDFSSGRYGVHAYTLAVAAGVRTRVTLERTSGAWSPALLILDDLGATVHDGERSVAAGPVLVEEVISGRGAAAASFTIVADTDRTFTVLLTSWANRDAAFSMRIPTDATYRVTVNHDCEDMTILYSPPNFDESDVVGGYYLLPLPEPSDLYARKADGCSRGNRNLIDVIYTAALRWSGDRPDMPHLSVRDLNEGPCSTVDHMTHNRGIDVDITAGCGTSVSCTDNTAAVDLAKILIDTGAVCGILFNDTAVQAEVNAYFASRFSYEPWRGQFMRTVTGHVRHFHVRVMNPDGTCN